jgi:hypothetical protein
MADVADKLSLLRMAVALYPSNKIRCLWPGVHSPWKRRCLSYILLGCAACFRSPSGPPRRVRNAQSFAHALRTPTNAARRRAWLPLPPRRRHHCSNLTSDKPLLLHCLEECCYHRGASTASDVSVRRVLPDMQPQILGVHYGEALYILPPYSGILRVLLSSLQPQRKYKQANIGRDAQRGQHRDHVATGPELFAAQAIFADFSEKLFVSCRRLSAWWHQTSAVCVS